MVSDEPPSLTVPGSLQPALRVGVTVMMSAIMVTTVMSHITISSLEGRESLNGLGGPGEQVR